MKEQNLHQTKKRIRIAILAILTCFFSANIKAQCIAGTNSPTGTITVSPYVQTLVSLNFFPGNYAIINVTNPGEYGIAASFGTYITVTDNSNVVQFSGNNTLYGVFPTAGLYRIHVHNSAACGTGGGSRIIALSPRNRALNFDGVNDYVNCGTAITGSLTGTNKLTVEGWVYPTANTPLGTIVGNHQGPTQFNFSQAGSNFSFFIGFGSFGITSVASVTLNTWQHVAGVYDGSSLKIYVNGALSGTTAVTSFNFPASSLPIKIGENGFGERFAGSIDEVRMWNRALCQGEIQNNINAMIPTNATNLMANYHFNQGVAGGTNAGVTTLVDDSGFGNNGTVFNTALTGATSNWVGSTSIPEGAGVTPFVSPTVAISSPTSVCSGNSLTLTASGVSTYSWVSGPTTATSVVTPTSTTTYSVAGTNSLGCISNMATQTINYNITPTVTVNSGSICLGSSFTINPTGAASYTIEGGASIVSPTTSTNYTVIGTGATGCISAAPVTSSVTVNPCTPAEALNFDGVNDYVNCGNAINSILDPLNTITAEAWIFPTSTVSPTYDAIVGNYNTNGSGMQFLLRQTADKYQFFVDAGSGFIAVTSAPATVSVSIWQHVAGTWDGSVLKLYINGALTATANAVGASFTSSSNQVWIGGQSINNEYFGGNLDEVRIWTRTLCQGEIQNNMNCEIPANGTGLLANYHFNQGIVGVNNASVNSLLDASGNAYSGTLVNMALNGSASNWVAPGGVAAGTSCGAFSGPVITVNSGSVCPGNSFTITPSGAFTYTIQGGSSVVSPTVTTSFTVTGTSSLGCLSSNTATSTVSMGICSMAEALNTDGSNDYVSIPQSLSSDFTIEYWLKTTQTGQTGPQWYFGNGLADAEVGGVTNDFGTALVGSQVAFGIGNPDVSIFSATNVNNGSWNHVAATWKQSTGEMKLYINGVLESTGTSGTALRTAPSDIKIGVLGTLLRYIDINMDELRLWNTVRTQCEINTYKNCEIPSNATGLVANYHFNQGYDANPNPGILNLTDASGNSNNGTLNNFALNGSNSNWIAPGGVVTGSTTPLAPPAVGSTVSNSVICSGNSTTLSGTGASTYTWTGGVADGVAFSPSVTASYTVTGTAVNGCENTAVSSVTVNSLPTVSVNSGSVCAGTSFTMTPSGASTYTYSSGSSIVSPSGNTSYTVTGADVNGCEDTAVCSVTVNSLPAVNASTSSSVICGPPFQGTATISASGAVTYTWSSSVSGASISVSPSVTTIYTVTGTDGNGCENSAVITQSVSTCAGMQQLGDVGSEIGIYPNPNNGVFSLQIQNVTNNTMISVTNVIGQVVLSETVTTEKTQIDIQSLNSGIYFVVVNQNNSKQTIKIIKE